MNANREREEGPGSRRLEEVVDGNWREVVSAPVSVLLVTSRECPHCRRWKEELSAYVERGGAPEGVRFGAVTVDGEDVSRFNEANGEWLERVEGVPFNVIYSGGSPRTSFYGSGLERLEKLLKEVKAGERD